MTMKYNQQVGETSKNYLPKILIRQEAEILTALSTPAVMHYQQRSSSRYKINYKTGSHINVNN